MAPGKGRNHPAARRARSREPKPIGSDIRSAAAEAGQSVQAYFLQAVRERMTRDGFTPTSDLWPDYTTKG